MQEQIDALRANLKTIGDLADSPEGRDDPSYYWLISCRASHAQSTLDKLESEIKQYRAKRKRLGYLAHGEK